MSVKQVQQTQQVQRRKQAQPISRLSSVFRLLYKIGGFCCCCVSLLLLFFWIAPSPIDPIRYYPTPKPELLGVFAPNEILTEGERLAELELIGAEDVAIDSLGRIYGGIHDGRILRVLADGTVEEFAKTDGRPLGMEFDADGNLIVCVANQGVVRIDAFGEVEVLTASAGAKAIHFADDLDIASDGKIYFSDASWKFKQQDYMLDCYEGRPHGRLIVYDPKTKESTVLLEDLHFANGVALSKNEEFVLVNETWRYRITRYWLKGSKAGTSDLFLDNLPGFPDGLDSQDGVFWLPLFTVRNDVLDTISPYPIAKKITVQLPQSLLPKPQAYGFVIAVDEQGNVLQSFQDTQGKVAANITSVTPHNGSLYLGTLEHAGIVRFQLPSDVSAATATQLASPAKVKSDAVNSGTVRTTPVRHSSLLAN